MIIIDKLEVMNLEGALRGMRNAKESWNNSDSYCEFGEEGSDQLVFIVGEKDLKLASTLANAGTDHGKFLRQIFVSMDITSPLYWWKEFDTYAVGVVKNSTSTMHKIHAKPITVYDFSCEDLEGYREKTIHTPNEINEETEIWLEHPVHKLYYISNQGRVKRKKYVTTHGRTWQEKILTNIVQADYYLRVNLLMENGKRSTFPVHVLVAQTFLPNVDNKPVVNHKDGNKQNEVVDNLEWVTQQENVQHAHDNKFQQMNNNLTALKISEANSRFSSEEREDIIKEYQDTNTSYTILAKKYNVSKTCILDVINRNYHHVKLNEFNKFKLYISSLEELRLKFIDTGDKVYWRQLIQQLPDSYNQTRTVTLDYAVLRNQYTARKNHKLQEWRDYCIFVECLPYFEELILTK